MSPGWVGVIVGAVLGATGGIILAGALAAGAQEDRCRACVLERSRTEGDERAAYGDGTMRVVR